MNETFRVGVIRVITLPDQNQAEIHGRLMEQYVPALKTYTVCIPDQPEGIHSLELKAAAVPKIIEWPAGMGIVREYWSLRTMRRNTMTGYLETG